MAVWWNAGLLHYCIVEVLYLLHCVLHIAQLAMAGKTCIRERLKQ
jgi:hypothetical protein